MDDHAQLFVRGTSWNKKKYKPVLEAGNYKEAATALQTSGYATDPDYADKISAIVEKYDLDEYDEVNPSLKSVDLNASIKDSAVHRAFRFYGCDVRLYVSQIGTGKYQNDTGMLAEVEGYVTDFRDAWKQAIQSERKDRHGSGGIA